MTLQSVVAAHLNLELEHPLAEVEQRLSPPKLNVSKTHKKFRFVAIERPDPGKTRKTNPLANDEPIDKGQTVRCGAKPRENAGEQ